MSRGERDIPYVEKDELSNIGCQWGRSERSKIHRGKVPKWVGAGGGEKEGLPQPCWGKDIRGAARPS
jgi:hypothetical protein